MGNNWKNEDIKFLRENYFSLGAEECARRLSRTYQATKKKAQLLKIKGDKSKRFTNERYDEKLLELNSPFYRIEPYVINSIPILHECINGHRWRAQPAVLLRGSGCPYCANSGIDYSKPCNLYYIRIEHESTTYYKIGITTLAVTERFRKETDKDITILYHHTFETGYEAQEIEQNVLHEFEQYRIRNRRILKSGGDSEIFTHDVLHMDGST